MALVFASLLCVAQSRLSVFIVTVGRTGSTILMNVVNSIDGFCIRGENNGVLGGLQRAVQDADYAYRMGRVDAPWHVAWDGAEKIDAPAFARALVSAFETHVLRCPSNATAVGFKEIRYEQMSTARQLIEFMLDERWFPSPRVIFNIRSNVTSVVNSRKRVNWAVKNDEEAHLRQLFDGFVAFAKQRPRSCIVVDYDEYKNNPDAFMPLFNFLGQQFHRASISHIMSKPLGH